MSLLDALKNVAEGYKSNYDDKVRKYENELLDNPNYKFQNVDKLRSDAKLKMAGKMLGSGMDKVNDLCEKNMEKVEKMKMEQLRARERKERMEQIRKGR